LARLHQRTDNSDLSADFSNYGPGVDLAAPGKDVYSTFPNHRNRIGKTNYGYGTDESQVALEGSGLL
jgi:thermitase